MVCELRKHLVFVHVLEDKVAKPLVLYLEECGLKDD